MDDSSENEEIVFVPMTTPNAEQQDPEAAEVEASAPKLENDDLAGLEIQKAGPENLKLPE